MEAYFGKPTKALKCKPPAACLAADVFVLVERAAVAYHPGTWQKKRAMCGLLIFKPPVCQVSAVGMRPHIHTHARARAHGLFPTILLSRSLSHMAWDQERGHISFGVVISLFMICLDIKLRTEQPLVQIKGLRIADAISDSAASFIETVTAKRNVFITTNCVNSRITFSCFVLFFGLWIVFILFSTNRLIHTSFKAGTVYKHQNMLSATDPSR